MPLTPHQAHLHHLNHLKQVRAGKAKPKDPSPELPGETLPGAQRNAYVSLKNYFDSLGLGTLAPKILEFLQEGYGNDQISILLQETEEYKKRFAGNEARKKAGYKVLSPAEYLALEDSYQSIMQAAGLPKGFYDQHSDFVNWIGGDVSPKEVQDRVQYAVQATTNADSAYKQALKQLGFTDGDMVAAMLDQKRAMPLLERQMRTVAIGTEALRRNLEFDPTRATQFALQGVTGEAARNAYQQIGEFLPDAEKLGKIHGESYTQADAENELLGGQGEAARKRKRLGASEQASFSGSGGVGRSSLGRSSAGSY